MKPIFDINNFQHPLETMLCENENELDIFAEYLTSVGRRTNGGSSYGKATFYRGGTYIVFNAGLYTDESTLRIALPNQPVLNFSDFDWSEFEELEEDKEIILDDFLKEFRMN